MRCGSGGGKGGASVCTNIGKLQICRGWGEEKWRSGEERLLEAILVYDDKTLKRPLLISS